MGREPEDGRSPSFSLLLFQINTQGSLKTGTQRSQIIWPRSHLSISRNHFLYSLGSGARTPTGHHQAVIRNAGSGPPPWSLRIRIRMSARKPVEHPSVPRSSSAYQHTSGHLEAAETPLRAPLSWISDALGHGQESVLPPSSQEMLGLPGQRSYWEALAMLCNCYSLRREPS